MSGKPSVTRAERVERIVAMMQDGEWERGKTAPVLAREWGVETNTVERMAAEAWNIVRRDIEDPDRVKVDVALVLMRDLRRASTACEFNAVAKLGDVVTRITGARAPERQEVSTMTPEQAAEVWKKHTGKDWSPE